MNILERLRSKSPYLDGSSAERTMEEAAAEIERLNALAAIVREQGFEIERLRTENRRWKQLSAFGTMGDQEAANLIERLRAALQEIADMRYDNTSAATLARRALEPKP